MKFGSILAATCIVAASMSTASRAADLPMRPVPVPTPAFTWTGFYSGIEIGGISGRFRNPTLSTPPFTEASGIAVPAATIPIGFGSFGAFGNGGRRDGDRSSPLAGTRGGYLHQFGVFVLGVETDTQVFSITRRGLPITAATAAAIALPFPFVPNNDYAIHSGHQSSVRGRIGLAWDRFMVYATGGVSFTDVKVTSVLNGAAIPVGGLPGVAVPAALPGTFAPGRDKSISGWTGGVGGEWAVTDATSIGVEYRHTSYERERLNAGSIAVIGPAAAVGVVPLVARADFSNDVVMFNYNIRFGRIFSQFDWHL